MNEFNHILVRVQYPVLPINNQKWVRVSPGVQNSEEPLENDLERFFAMIRFDGRAKLDKLPIE